MSRMVISEIHSRLILVLVMASRVYRWQALETQLLSEEQKSVSSPAPKMSYFPCRQNGEYCSAVPRVLPVLEVPDTPHPSACPCQYLARPYIIVSKYQVPKTPLTVSIPKWTLYQPKGLKASQTDTSDWENSTFLPQSVAHQAKPCHQNGRREGKARPNPSAIYLIPLVYSIYLSL